MELLDLAGVGQCPRSGEGAEALAHCGLRQAIWHPGTYATDTHYVYAATVWAEMGLICGTISCQTTTSKAVLTNCLQSNVKFVEICSVTNSKSELKLRPGSL